MNDADNINFHEVQVWLQAYKLSLEMTASANPDFACKTASNALAQFRKDFNIKGETNND